MSISKATALVALLLTGCQTLGIKETAKEEKYYMHEMNLEVNGARGIGMIVVPYSKMVDVFAAWNYRASELINIFNCYFDDPIKPYRSIFKKGQSFIRYKFEMPNDDFEHCPLYISAYDISGKHSFGAVYFRTDESLRINQWCNGIKRIDDGASVCQTRAGSVVRVEADEPIEFVREHEGCGELIERGLNVYEYTSGLGECIYYFGGQSGKFHKHVSYGYNEIPVRSY